MPLGDSITCGHSSESTAGYRGLLWNKLKTAGYAVDYVGTQTMYPAADVPDMDLDHEGHGGWLITERTGAKRSVLDNLTGWLAQAGQPNVVLLHLGTNDSGEPDFAEQGVADMGRILEVLRQRAPGAHVLLSTLMWRNDATRYARIQAFNARMGGLVAVQRARGQKVTLVDLHAKVPGGDANFADGLHPTRAGYGLMADAWFEAVEAIYPDPATLVEAALPAAETDASLESHGSKWINLGYFMTPKSRIEVDFQYPVTPTGGILFGPYDTGAKLSTICWNNDGCFSFVFRDNGYGESRSDIALDDKRHTAVIDVLHKKIRLEREGAVEWEGANPSGTTLNNTAAWPIVLFGATENAQGTGKQTVSAKIFSVKIYEDDHLVHHFLPCVKGNDSGMLDVMTGEFKYGAGKGEELTLSGSYATVADDGYAASTAVSSAGPSVNTGYFMTPNSRIEVDFRYPQTPNGNILFGPWDSDCRLSTICWNNNRKFSFSLGDGGLRNIESEILCDTRRHTAVIDVLNRKVRLVRNVVVEWERGCNSDATCNNTAAWPVVLYGATKDAQGNGKQNVSAQIYGVKIYENNELVREFVPCVQAGQAGFHELMTGKFVMDSRAGGAAQPLSAGGDIATFEEGYVESDGTTGINTGYRMKPSSRVEVDYACLANKWNGKFVFGAWKNETSLQSLVWYSGNELNFILKDGSGFKTVITKLVGDTYRHTVSIDAPMAGFDYVTGFTTNWHGQAEAVPVNTANNPLALFATSSNADGTTFETAIGARIYSAKIYEDGQLVKELLPYVKNGQPGFRDSFSGDFVGMAVGTKKPFLTVGGAVARDAASSDAYVESDGTQVLNTKYFVSTDTRIEVDFQALDMSENKLVYGAWNASTGVKCCGWHDGGTFKCILGGGGKSPNNALGTLDHARHTSIIDIPTETLSLLTDGETTYTMKASGTGLVPGEKGLHPIGVFGGLKDAEGTTTTMSGKSRIYAVRFYEKGELVREFLPCKRGASVGLYDALSDTFAVKHSASVAEPKIGGCGWGGDHAAFHTEPTDGVVPVDGELTLSAFAPGAIRYQWHCDGKLLPGETGETLTIDWRRKPRESVYTVKAAFDCAGTEVEVESAAATVSFNPAGCVLFIK